ncbi:hypothetical protein D3C77_397700 [compost metagenome]
MIRRSPQLTVSTSPTSISRQAGTVTVADWASAGTGSGVTPGEARLSFKKGVSGKGSRPPGTLSLISTLVGNE